MTQDNHTRRRIVRTTAATALLGLAGCGQPEGEDEPGPDNETSPGDDDGTPLGGDGTPGGEEGTPTGEEDGTTGGDARLRVAHAIPDAPGVDVALDGEDLFTDVEYGQVADYEVVERDDGAQDGEGTPDGETPTPEDGGLGGETPTQEDGALGGETPTPEGGEGETPTTDLGEDEHELTIRPADGDDDVHRQSIELQGADYSIVLLGEVEGEQDTQLEIVQHDAPELDEDRAAIQLVHTSPDAPPVTVTTEDDVGTTDDGTPTDGTPTDGTPTPTSEDGTPEDGVGQEDGGQEDGPQALFTAVEYGADSDFEAADAGSYTLEIRPARGQDGEEGDGGIFATPTPTPETGDDQGDTWNDSVATVDVDLEADTVTSLYVMGYLEPEDDQPDLEVVEATAESRAAAGVDDEEGGDETPGDDDGLAGGEDGTPTPTEGTV